MRTNKNAITLDEIAVSLSEMCNLLQLAYEEVTQQRYSDLSIDNEDDVVSAICYAHRADLVATLVDIVQGSLMKSADELDSIVNQELKGT